MALSASEIVFLLFSIVSFIFSAVALAAFNGMNMKAQGVSTNNFQKMCGVKRGYVTSGITFSALMLVVSLVVIFWYSYDLYKGGMAGMAGMVGMTA